jgi:hypothetical protein
MDPPWDGQALPFGEERAGILCLKEGSFNHPFGF